MATRDNSACRAIAVVAATVIVLTGCRYDYLNNRDTIAMSAGSAMRGNAAVHTIDPWPAVARHTHQTTDAKKTTNAIELYREKPKSNQLGKGGATTSKP